jgi:hypothetical protein
MKERMGETAKGRRGDKERKRIEENEKQNRGLTQMYADRFCQSCFLEFNTTHLRKFAFICGWICSARS